MSSTSSSSTQQQRTTSSSSSNHLTIKTASTDAEGGNDGKKSLLKRGMSVTEMLRGTKNACYCMTCPRTHADRAPAKTECYSPSCRKVKFSWWKHPKLKKFMLRAKISCALRVRPPLEPFSSFVPRGLHDYLIQLAKNNTQEEVPFGATRTGSVLFADASGFTALTEQLATQPNGAEELCWILNNFFTILVDVVHSYCGDIVKFAGDAVSIVWVVDDEPGCPRDLNEATLWATQCACEIHRRLHNFPATPSVFLSLHMGIGVGQLTCIHVGGVFGRWEYVVAGPPLSQIAIAEPLAEPGETVLSPEAYAYVKDYLGASTRMELLAHKCVKTPCNVRHARSKNPDPSQYEFVRIDAIKPNLPLPHPLSPSKLNDKHIELLRRYIPAAVLPKLKAGHHGHLAELREVSVLFVKCEGINITATSEGNCARAIESGQQLMLSIQHAVYFHQGSINKFLVDDKGLLVLCVFGLPPMAHSDDPKRAVLAGLMLVENLQKLGPEIHCSVGVATGVSFCGVVGSKDRREYTVMGDTVNLSARLMGVAKPDEVIVDKLTMLRSFSFLDYKDLGSISLKGKAKPEPIFQPMCLKAASASKEESKLVLQSRVKEYEQLHGILTGRGSGTLVLTGDRGSGKGGLVDAICKIGEDSKLYVLKGHSKGKSSKGNDVKLKISPAELEKGEGGEGEKDEGKLEGPSFAAWSAVFSSMFKVASREGNMTMQEWVLASLKPADHLHAPLLNLVVPDLNLPFPPRPRESETPDEPETPSVSMAKTVDEVPLWLLNPPQKISRLKKTLIDLLTVFSDARPTMIVLHLQTGTSMQSTVDPESWGLAHQVSKLCVGRDDKKPKMWLCVVSRPLVNHAPVEFLDIVEVAKKRNTLVQLNPLSKEQQYQHLRQCLGVGDLYPLPNELVEYVADIAAGNPKNIEELVNQLISQKGILVKDNRVRVVDNLNRISLPEKMVGTAKETIDRMQPRHQLLVKVASFFNFFSLGMLQQVFPYEDEIQHLPYVLAELVESGVLVETHAPNIPREVLNFDAEATVCYSFQSKLFQQQANKLLLESYKQDIGNNITKMTMMNTIRNMIQIQSKTRNWLMSIGMCDRSIPIPRKKTSEGDDDLVQYAQVSIC